VVNQGTGTWHLAEPTRLRRGVTFAAVFTSFIIMLLVSVLKDYRSWVWQYALAMVVAFDGFALGLTAYLTSRHWGWTGLWLYLVDWDLDYVVPAVERGLSDALIPFRETKAVPTRRFLKKTTHAFELAEGVRVWIAPVARAGQMKGQPPETLVAIENAERIRSEDLEKVKNCVALALPSEASLGLHAPRLRA